MTATELWFYHLERAPLDAVLPTLLQRTLERGWRAVVRVGSAERAQALDGHLWTYQDDSFLPHGLAHQPQADDQPILLTTETDRPNKAEALFLVDGAPFPELEAEERLEGLSRCILLFNGQDAQAVQEARALWKRAKDTGLDLSYWQQAPNGGWQKRA